MCYTVLFGMCSVQPGHKYYKNSNWGKGNTALLLHQFKKLDGKVREQWIQSIQRDSLCFIVEAWITTSLTQDSWVNKKYEHEVLGSEPVSERLCALKDTGSIKQ
jgi:hypothetical protein